MNAEDKKLFVKKSLEEYLNKNIISEEQEIINKLLKLDGRSQKASDFYVDVSELTEEKILQVLKKNPSCIAYIKNQTYNMIETIIKIRGCYIKYVNWDNIPDDKIEKLCIMACKNGGSSETLKNCKNLTKEILLEAISNYTEIWFHM